MSCSRSGQAIAGDPVPWVLQNSRTKGSAKVVLLSIAAGATFRKCISCVPVSRIMYETGLSRTQTFHQLADLKRHGEITLIGVAANTCERVYHLSKFCESGTSQGVRLPGLPCPHVQHFQQHRRLVRQTAYIKTSALSSVRETGVASRPTPLTRVVQNAANSVNAAKSTTDSPRVLREWVEAYSTENQLRWREYDNGWKFPFFEPANDVQPSTLEGSPEERAQWLDELVRQFPTLARMRDMGNVVATKRGSERAPVAALIDAGADTAAADGSNCRA